MHDKKHEPEFRIEHQDVAVVEQGVNGADHEEHHQPPEIDRNNAESFGSSAFELHRKTETEQDTE